MYARGPRLPTLSAARPRLSSSTSTTPSSLPLPLSASTRVSSGSSLPLRGASSLLGYVVDRPVASFFSAILSILVFSLVLGIATGDSRNRERDSHLRSVVARDWSHPSSIDSSSSLFSFNRLDTAGQRRRDHTVLILTPMKNSIEHIWHFFHLLDTLTYPRHLLQVAVLVSDSQDRTYLRALELADERQYSTRSSSSRKRGRYRNISVLKKDFALHAGQGGSNVGKDRHDFNLQIERRKLLANSRTWLLTSTLSPEVDWVLWLDVDVVEYDKDLIQTLLSNANSTNADVIVPNCMWKTYNEMGAYDRNNWQETEQSEELKLTLDPEDVLIEGYEAHLKTFRKNMADMYPPTNDTPEFMNLDGVGGCATLVNADVHRKGAVFPSWVVDHQLETEGFAQLAKKLGAKLVGLPKYYVYHGLYG